MKITIYGIRATAGGAEAELSFEISDGEHAVQHLKGTVSADMMAELGLPSSITEPIAIDRERCDEILLCVKKTAAIKQGITFLEYAQNTKKGLCEKLRRKGYSSEIAQNAVEYLAERGYINESREAEFLVQTMAERKLYGKNRIKRELFAKGFESNTIQIALEEVDPDFAAICAKRISSLGGTSLFETREKKQKTISALLRYGFSYEDIKEGLQQLLQE